MFNEISEKPELLAKILVIGIIAVVIFFISIIILIWSPKKSVFENNENTKTVIQSGKYSYISTNEKQVVEEYCRNLSDILSRGDMDEIMNLMSKEYLEHNKFDKEKLKISLKQRGILEVLLKFYDYKSVINPRYGRIFEIELGSYDSMSKDKIYLIEKSPRNFKLSFDGYLGNTSISKEYIREGLKLSINNIFETVDKISINVKIENNLTGNMIFNKNNLEENVFLLLSNGNKINLSSVWLSGGKITLNPNKEINLELQFNPGYMQSGYATSIIFKDVYDETSQQLKEIEFPL